MKTRPWIAALTLPLVLSSCRSAGVDASRASKLKDFASFLSEVEAAAQVNHDALVASPPFRGSNYAVSTGSVSKGVFVSYELSTSPCVSPSRLETEVLKLGFSKFSRGVDPHGSRQYEVPNKARYAVHEIYRDKATGGTRSINVDYLVETGAECVSLIFVDFPE